LENSYWDCLDAKLIELQEKGFTKLSSIEKLDLSEIDNSVSAQMGEKTFKESCPAHKIFREKMLLEKFLTPKLYQLAKEKFDYKGSIANQYHVARRVKNGGSDKYRAHFDSHLFTIVFPIQIPQAECPDDSNGELLFFPKIRKHPKSEFRNFFGKLWFRQYASEKGINKLSLKNAIMEESFSDYEPLLFLGNIVFHTNKPVFTQSESHRLTLISHYFDPGSKYGIGNMLRVLRRR